MDEEKETCTEFLRNLKVKKKQYAAFNASLKTLQSYAAERGLLDKEINLLCDVIMNSDLGARKLVSLMKCLIPRYKIDRGTIMSIVTWLLASVDKLPVTLSTVTIQWIVGVLDQQLACRRTVNLFYSVFFHVMLKKEKLQQNLARLLYAITKPEDVTRRDATRLLNLQRTYSKRQRHILALLSLFKSYKPELVPEKIESVNVESAWKPIPEPLRLMLVQAKARNDLRLASPSDSFKWTTFGPRGAKKGAAPLIPSVAYFQIGCGLFEQDGKSIFDIFSVEDLGREQSNVQLPSNAVSLLLNQAGYHLLAFSGSDYQSRFSYNLYNTLFTAFILEAEKCSTKEAESLLELTAEFSSYLQQGIPVVARFLHEYLYLNPGKHQSKLLGLLQWSTSVSLDELRKMLEHLGTMFLESPLPSKIEILRTLTNLLTNLFVNEGWQEPPTLFLRQQAKIEDFKEAVELISSFAENLIVFGLTIHSLNPLLLSEALSFYECISLLESRSSVSLFTLPPAGVIYACLFSKHCALLSRACNLLLRYRHRCLIVKLNPAVLNKVHSYAEDMITVLWYDDAFTTRKHNHWFPRNLPQRVLKDFSVCQLDKMANVSNHFAVLPYKFVLSKMGLRLNTKQDAVTMAFHYYPAVHRFLSVFQGVA